MNKTEFIAAVAAKEGLEKKTAEKAVNAVIACVGDALAAGDKIQIAGFGTFEVRERAARPSTFPLARFPLSRQARALRTRLQNNFAGFSGAEMPLIFLMLRKDAAFAAKSYET